MRLNATSTQTHHKRAFDFAAPSADMIELDDMSFVMFRIPRFNGHLGPDWKLGHHSFLVAALLAKEAPAVRAAALLHDASECYTGDCPGPFKRLLGEAYKALERPIEAAIAQRFDVPYPWPKIIKSADLLSQDIEATLMLPGGPLAGGNLVRDDFVLLDEHRALVDRIWRLGPADYHNAVSTLCATRAPHIPGLALSA